MELIHKIDLMIKYANYRIQKLNENSYEVGSIDAYWNKGYDNGYIAALYKYIDDLSYLKDIIIEINKDDDDV
jgi:hypothetical protein